MVKKQELDQEKKAPENTGINLQADSLGAQ